MISFLHLSRLRGRSTSEARREGVYYECPCPLPNPPPQAGEGEERAEFSLRRFRRQPLALLDRRLDGADHVEGSLRQVVILAFHQALEAADGVGEIDKDAGRAGEHFGDVEGLRQEALDLARAG